VIPVPANLIVREKAFNCLIDRNAMSGKLVVLKVVFKVRWCKPTPVNHCLILQSLGLHGKVASGIIRLRHTFTLTRLPVAAAS
jgi:hypothetical protein